MFDTKPMTLSPCTRCSGTGSDRPGETCPACDGGKFAPVFGDLGETRSLPSRPFVYNPGTGDLSITRKGKATGYRVREFRCDRVRGEAQPRAFEAKKINRFGVPTDTYHVRIAPGARSCDCTGKLAESSEWADRRAWEAGEPLTFRTFGCVHLDAIVLLLVDGLFETVPVEVA